MKHKVIAFVLAGVFAVAPCFTQNTFAGGIPVIDAASLAQAIQQVQHMLQQIELMKNQIEIAETELDRISGARDMVGVLHSAYDLAVTVDQDEILEDLGLKSAEENGLVGQEAELFDEGNANVAVRLGQSEKSLEQATERFSELAKLVAKVNDCPDPKDIQDLQARIQAEQVLLQNERIKLSMIQAQTEAREAAHKAKVRQALIKSAGELVPIDW